MSWYARRHGISRRPFLPSDRPRGIHFERAIDAAIRASLDLTKIGAAAIAKKLWPTDQVTPLLLRSAVSPTTTTSASALAIDTAIDFIGSLAPLSAAARLINAGMRVSLSGINSVTIPRRQGGKAANNVAWIAQGSPIPIKQYVLDEATLGPTCKLALLCGMTNELAQYTAGQDVVSTLMREDLAASLDACDVQRDQRRKSTKWFVARRLAAYGIGRDKQNRRDDRRLGKAGR